VKEGRCHRRGREQDRNDARGKGETGSDVDFEGVKEKAAAITPVPGGVGPMTITMLYAQYAKGGKGSGRK